MRTGLPPRPALPSQPPQGVPQRPQTVRGQQHAEDHKGAQPRPPIPRDEDHHPPGQRPSPRPRRRLLPRHPRASAPDQIDGGRARPRPSPARLLPSTCRCRVRS
ncbi:unnamed protein product [Linum tenue]|uniref:Uncharacterized protein n=1 Tax=Linum tenue TaxID=586396 RepID=A0AAV0MQC9_9ROSI|nr:unnamed protein product [Linum tenue]